MVTGYDLNTKILILLMNFQTAQVWWRGRLEVRSPSLGHRMSDDLKPLSLVGANEMRRELAKLLFADLVFMRATSSIHCRVASVFAGKSSTTETPILRRLLMCGPKTDFRRAKWVR